MPRANVSFSRRARFIAMLAGAASALAIAAAAPASAGLPWGNMSTCTSAAQNMRPARTDRAIRACTTIIENGRTSMVNMRRALMARGGLYVGRGNFDLALADYRRAADQNPTDPRGHLALGRTQARVNDLDGALRSFETAYQHASGDLAGEARIAAGDVHRQRGEWVEATVAYSDADVLTVDADQRVRLLIGRGHAKAGWGDLVAAMSDYSLALAEDRTSIEARLALADANRLSAFPTGGEVDWPHYTMAVDLYGEAIAELEARRDGADRRQLNATILTGRGELFLRRYLVDGDRSVLSLAGRDFDAAINLNSGDVRALSGRAAAYAQNPADRERAMADLNRALSIAPDSPELYRARANIYAEAGDSERAVRDYDQTIRRGGANSYAAYYRRGVIYLEEGDLLRAEQSFTRAASLAAAGEVGPGVDPHVARAQALAMRSRTAWGRMDEPGADVRAIARRARDDADMAASLSPNRTDFVAESCLARTVAGGEWDRAALACRQAINMAEDAGVPAQLSNAYGTRGLLQLRRALSGDSNVNEVIHLQFAENDLTRAVRANPDDGRQTALYRYALGVTLECLNRRLEADRITAAALNADRGVAARFEAHRIRRCR
jgi:tetratricopeptide (TPR) repeat protein